MAAEDASDLEGADPWDSADEQGEDETLYEDERVNELSMENDYPEFVGTKWDDIAPSDRRAAWIVLREWVDRFIYRYEVPVQTLPPCWYLHPLVVEELYAGMLADISTWEEAAPSLTPMTTFNYHVPMMLERLGRSSMSNCVNGHRGAERDQETLRYPWQRQYDEQDWQAHINMRTEHTHIARAEDADVVWQAVLADEADGELLTSDPIMVIAQAKREEPAVAAPSVISAANPEKVAIILAANRPGELTLHPR